jgi:hypothetical protein
LNKAIIAEITTTIRGIPQEVPVGEPEGLVVPSVVNFDNVHVVAKRFLFLPGWCAGGRTRTRSEAALGYALEAQGAVILPATAAFRRAGEGAAAAPVGT